MGAWTFADVWEAIAAKAPDRPVVVQGPREITWGQFDARADALAAHMIARGVSHEAKVAAYLHNGPEYLETYFAAFKAGIVSRIPLGRVGETRDLVGPAIFLCSDAASFVTGQVLGIDGGLTATQ